MSRHLVFPHNVSQLRGQFDRSGVASGLPRFFFPLLPCNLLLPGLGLGLRLLVVAIVVAVGALLLPALLGGALLLAPPLLAAAAAVRVGVLGLLGRSLTTASWSKTWVKGHNIIYT